MTYPTITPLPVAPSRQDPANFSVRADALVAALPALVTETNTAGVYTEAQAAAALASKNLAAAAVISAQAEVVLAQAQVTLATTQKNLAVAAAAAAVVTANATVWVSGSNYAEFANVISPIDKGTYRAKLAITNSIIDPSGAAAQWQRISSSAGGVSIASILKLT